MRVQGIYLYISHIFLISMSRCIPDRRSGDDGSTSYFYMISVILVVKRRLSYVSSWKRVVSLVDVSGGDRRVH